MKSDLDQLLNNKNKIYFFFLAFYREIALRSLFQPLCYLLIFHTLLILSNLITCCIVEWWNTNLRHVPQSLTIPPTATTTLCLPDEMHIQCFFLYNQTCTQQKMTQVNEIQFVLQVHMMSVEYDSSRALEPWFPFNKTSPSLSSCKDKNSLVSYTHYSIYIIAKVVLSVYRAG